MSEWQQHQRALSRCCECGKPSGDFWRCRAHRVIQSQKARDRRRMGKIRLSPPEAK